MATATTSPVLATSLIRTLFLNMKEEALAFLAGVWLNNYDQSLRFVALRHAAAFLDAHAIASQPLDFQTILPSFLAALPTLDAEGREAAMDCISILSKLADRNLSSVYGLDSIYGDKSCEHPPLKRGAQLTSTFRQSAIFREE